MNIPPPSFAAKYGNLHIFPKPTALPAAASTKPIEPLNEFRFVCVSINQLNPPIILCQHIFENF